MAKRQRRQSDEVYNARRRAKRYVKSLEKQVNQSKSATERRVLRRYIRNLNEVIAGSYRGSGRSIDKSVAALKSQTQRGKTGTVRANYVFQQQIGLAGSGRKSALGKYGAQKVKIFYTATQRIWQGAPASQRNKLIMAELGASSLGEAFDMVMKRNKTALDMVKGLYEPIGDTAENIAFAQGLIEDIQTSPEYLDYVNEWR
nr:MAG TPA: hypothetical protein [Bacteriophage sp.]